MSQKELVKLFENRNVRVVWDDEKQEWYFSVVDVCGVMVDSKDYQTARKYWNKLKERLRKEGNESVTNCHQLKLQAADGKYYKTDVANVEDMSRRLHSQIWKHR
jgi:prophage antirepressor-like protein